MEQAYLPVNDPSMVEKSAGPGCDCKRGLSKKELIS